MARQGSIVKVAGPLVVAKDIPFAKLYDVVYVGQNKLVGEIIEIKNNKCNIQVYENTAGLTVGDIVETSGAPLSIQLGAGLLGNVFDGIGRPLDAIREQHGDRIEKGIVVHTLSQNLKWEFTGLVKAGDEVGPGHILGYVSEKEIQHRILTPVGIFGKIIKIENGGFCVTDTVAIIETKKGNYDVKLSCTWPVRVPRPYSKKLTPSEPLVTGQRIIDTIFPIARGGVGAIPGPFGSGKTVVQHQIAKWADADIVVYIGCGERGNEICDVLHEFPALVTNGKSIMDRTVLIANTSDMPVAAREASIYTGITIAEYFRDMGYSVVLLADSTSRWAEAIREISGRSEELPGEEGYPAYLSSRISGWYERAGSVITLSKQKGSVTVIGAVSPAGGDLQEPVAQATMRIVKTFWALSPTLAHRRHFPAIDPMLSYSLYIEPMEKFYIENIDTRFLEYRNKAVKILQKGAELTEIVRLVGIGSLTENERKIMSTAKSITDDFLYQNAFNQKDTFTELKTQIQMLKEILEKEDGDDE